MSTVVVRGPSASMRVSIVDLTTAISDFVDVLNQEPGQEAHWDPDASTLSLVGDDNDGTTYRMTLRLTATSPARTSAGLEAVVESPQDLTPAEERHHRVSAREALETTGREMIETVTLLASYIRARAGIDAGDAGLGT